MDLCLTDLIKAEGIGGSDFTSRKWSEVISLPRFRAIKAKADEIFTGMAEYDQICPRVATCGRHGVTLIYHNKSRTASVSIIIDSGMPLRFFYEDGEVKEFPELLYELAFHLHEEEEDDESEKIRDWSGEGA